MGTLDDFRKSFGETALDPQNTAGQRPSVWYDLCVCGHLDRYHSPSIGGTFPLEPPIEAGPVGSRRMIVQALDGCRGAMVNRGQPTTEESVDRTTEPATVTTRFLATCPCTELRAVATVDRPNRYFNQRMPVGPVNRANPLRHPFMVGIRAFTTHLSKRRMALSDPTWATAEFDRRFVWLDGKRRCAISRCEATDGVWPVFINADTSELRCEKHRPEH